MGKEPEKLHYFGHLMRRTDSLEKTLMLGKIDREPLVRRQGSQVSMRVARGSAQVSSWKHSLMGNGSGEVTGSEAVSSTVK